MKHNRAVHIQLLLYIKTREIESQIEEKTSTKGKTLSVIAMVHCASHNFTSSATTLSVLFGVGNPTPHVITLEYIVSHFFLEVALIAERDCDVSKWCEAP